MPKALPDKFLVFELSVPLAAAPAASALLERLVGQAVIESKTPEGESVQLQVFFPASAKAKKEILRLRLALHSPSRGEGWGEGGGFKDRTYSLNDWKTKWKESFKAQKISRRIWIVPSWEKSKAPKGSVVIHLDPGMAFGTGLHPTTRFVLRLLDRYSGRIRSFVDAGTGSGVLTIAAAKLGVPVLEAFDLDEQSIETARENFELNTCPPIRLSKKRLEDYRARQRFDFVAANIETWVLLKNKTRLLRLLAPGGLLAMTGIGLKNEAEVLKHYASPQLELLHRFRGREWCGLCFRRT